MGKLLRVLTIFLFILAGAALGLGIALFEKRELLKGRTQKLEKHVQALTEAYIEDKPADKEENTFTAKDIEECTATIVENPKRSEFWDTYKLHLEKQDLEKMKVEPRRRELMTYYLYDQVELDWLGRPKIKKDEFGVPITKGPGTMQDLLDEILQKAGAQYHLLNETRLQLKDLRDECIKTIEELNETKRELRKRLDEIVQLKKRIAELEAEVARLKQRIAELEEEKRALEEKVAEQEKKIKELEDQKVELQAQIEELKRKIDDLIKINTGIKPDEVQIFRFEPGAKGKIVSVNSDWNYVVIELDDVFLQEIAEIKSAAPPQPELLVNRPGLKDPFVTKVKLTQIKRIKKLGIADILTDWQQTPIKVGDVVSF